MMETDIIVVGAGASGLAAAYELSLVNKKLIVLEARNRMGGRIHSIADPKFAGVVETGAEFVHGKLPVTLGLLEKGKIKHHSAEGKMWEIEKGQITKTKEFIEDWNELMKQLDTLEKDIPIAQFLNIHFPGEEHKDLRTSATKFIEGYNAADANKASSLALREEWKKEDDDHQDRLQNGYGELMEFLANEITKRGNKIFFNHVVEEIKWQKRKVVITTTDRKEHTASRVLITIPLGVWQAEGQQGHVTFSPELTEKLNAAKQIGFGGVIKINLQFENNFWEDETPAKMKNAGFIFTDAEIPTWWTQEPVKNGQLTGWIAGPKARELENISEEEVLNKSLQTLAYSFGVEKNFIEEKLKGHHITNWNKEIFSRGAYSYAMINSDTAKKILSQPVEQTIYFAGEALYEGTETGTVEGALANGIEVARKIIAEQDFL